MKIYVTSLDQPGLQNALDTACGSGVFTTGRDKLEDGTRPLYYACNDDIDPAILAQATTVAAQQDQDYLQASKIKMLDAIGRAAIKCRQRQPFCAYTTQDQDAAQAWLDDPNTVCPLVVQVRAISQQITDADAAQQIVSMYQNFLQYSDRVNQAQSAAQTAMIAATTVLELKTAYQNGVDQFALLENTDYSI